MAVMKKFLLVFLSFLIFCFAACTENPDPPRVFTTVPTESTAAASETTGSSEPVESSTTETTAEQPVNPPPAFEPEKSINASDVPFVGFYNYISGIPITEQAVGNGIPITGSYFPKTEIKNYYAGTKRYGFTEWKPLIVTVTGYDGRQKFEDKRANIIYSLYYVSAMYENGEVCGEYIMYIFGTPENPCYMRPHPATGTRYLRLNPVIPDEGEEPVLPATSLFLIEERDGVEYVYGIGADLSHMDCAIPITDPYENAVYKPGEDDDIIAYMEANDIPAPTYDYKCELSAFIKEMNDDIS